MADTNKKPDVVELARIRRENEEKELTKLSKMIPTVESLLNSIPFMKSFASKMNSQVFKTDTLHIMHTCSMMEILSELKLLNENLENLLDAQEASGTARASKKLSRDK